MPLRAVIDTNVVYAGLRSRNGSPLTRFLTRLSATLWTLVLSNTVLTEYEEILKREAPAIGITIDRVDLFLDSRYACMPTNVIPLKLGYRFCLTPLMRHSCSWHMNPGPIIWLVSTSRTLLRHGHLA